MNHAIVFDDPVGRDDVDEVTNQFICPSTHRDVVKLRANAEKVVSTTKRTVLFPPLQDVLDFDHNAPAFLKKIKRNGPAFVALKVLQQFRDTHGHDPRPDHRAADLATLLAIWDQVAAPPLQAGSVFARVFAQISPTAAIVGGELAQEIIKAVSQREVPHHNVFLFDPETCCGFVESIGN